MRVLMLGAQKGGTGKSMLSLSLAVAAQQAGERVAGLDADRQKSFAKWGSRRPDPDLVVRPVQPSEVDVMLARAKANGFTLAIVDTPGALDISISHILRRADFLLVPCQPSLMDIEATDELLPVLASIGRPWSFVLSRTDPRSPGKTQEARELLECNGTVAPGSIAHRTAFQDALNIGAGVTELGGRGETEIRDLWEWTRERLPR